MVKVIRLLKSNKLLLTLLFLLVFGLLVGIFFGYGIEQARIADIVLEKQEKNRIWIFVNLFTKHFWYLFLVWWIGKYRLGLFFGCFCLWVIGIIHGISLAVLVRIEALLGVYSFLKYCFLDLLLIIPLLIFVIYQNFRCNENDRQRQLVVILLVVAIYSFVGALI